MAYALAFLVGLALGSFLNVVITRLPRGEQVMAGRSRCPHCRTTLPWRDNLPLLSYLWLGGRCRSCGAPISRRYPLVELAGGILAAALWWRFPASPVLLAYGPFCGALLALSAIDLEHRLLPDAVTLPGVALGLALALFLPHLTFLEAAAGAAAGAALFYGIGWVYQRLTGRKGMGGGDAKLLAFIGAFLGLQSLPFVIFISAALGTLAGWRGPRHRQLAGGRLADGRHSLRSFPGCGRVGISVRAPGTLPVAVGGELTARSRASLAGVEKKTGAGGAPAPQIILI
jgi:leader peptidase (prepilin peptidase)/N-methyltransferase